MECVYIPELRNYWFLETHSPGWVPACRETLGIHRACGPPSGREGEGTASPDSSISTSTGIRSES